MAYAYCSPLENKKGPAESVGPSFILVGTGGFEPPAPCSQGRCADQTALRPDYVSTESLKVGNVVTQGGG